MNTEKIELQNALNAREAAEALIDDLRATLAKKDDEIRGLREEYEQIQTAVNWTRRGLNMWGADVSRLADDVSDLLKDMEGKMTEAQHDSAALRGVLEGIRDTARKGENIDSDLTETHRQIYVLDLLGSVAHKAADGLREHKSGAALRKDMGQLEAMVAQFEKGMQETGGWRYGNDRTLAERVQRVVDHYTRMAARAVSDAHSFKDGVVSWLRGIAINAQAVSWAGTHHEKDARLRGLIEVVETAISAIDEKRADDRLTNWNGVVDSWMKSDFPTREMRRRIFDLEAEIKRLKQNGHPQPETVEA